MTDRKTQKADDNAVSDAATAVLASAALGGEVPTEVLVVPWGEVESRNGRFVLDAEAAERVVAAFDAQRTDLPIDYEHQTLGGTYASPTGQAPAAGWIKRLVLRAEGEAPGLFAVVEWTEAARAQLAGRQYRYLSPVAIVRKADRRVVAIHSVALTNKPAIVGAQPIVNRACNEIAKPQKQEEPMNEPLERLRGQLGLAADAEAETVLVAASDRITALSEGARRTEAETRVAAALEAGKLTESQKDWAIALAMKDAAAFDEWEKAAPVVVSLGRSAAATSAAALAADHTVIAAKARAEFRANPALALITDEDAYVALALREANAPAQG
jgi:phage I-like protein